MKMAAFKVAVLDRFSDWQECFPGGNAMNQSVHFKQMGWDAAFVGALGSDREGELLRNALDSYGVDTGAAHSIDGTTATNTLRTDANGERHSVPGAWQGGVYETYRLTASDWAVLSEMDLWVTHADHSDFDEALHRKKSGQFMAVDFLHHADYELLVHSLSAVNIAFFGGVKEMEAPLFNIAKVHHALIVLTLGAEGSVAFMDGKTIRQPALSLEKVVDTTGCGDAFQAGFTDSFYRFKDVSLALEQGALRGRETAGRIGALPWPVDMSGAARVEY